MPEKNINIPEYHDVIAQSQRDMITATVAQRTEVVRELCIHNIIQAYTIWVTDTPEEAELINKELEAMKKEYKDKKNKKEAQVYDVIVERLKKLNIYNSDGKLDDEFPIDKLKIIMFYYQCKIGIKPTQVTRQITRTYERTRDELYM